MQRLFAGASDTSWYKPVGVNLIINNKLKGILYFSLDSFHMCVRIFRRSPDNVTAYRMNTILLGYQKPSRAYFYF